MDEKEFVDEAIKAMGKLTDEIENFSIEGIEKGQCYSKACELMYWLNNYMKTLQEVEGEIDE